MDRYIQFQKIICKFLIFAVLISLSGCYSSRIPTSKFDLPLPDSSKYHYIIHTKNSDYWIRHVIISNGILSGKIDVASSFHNKIHIYLSSDTVMNVNRENIVYIPIRGIMKVERENVSIGDTILLGCFIIAIPVAVFILLSSLAWSNY